MVRPSWVTRYGILFFDISTCVDDSPPPPPVAVRCGWCMRRPHFILHRWVFIARVESTFRQAPPGKPTGYPLFRGPVSVRRRACIYACRTITLFVCLLPPRPSNSTHARIIEGDSGTRATTQQQPPHTKHTERQTPVKIRTNVSLPVGDQSNRSGARARKRVSMPARATHLVDAAELELALLLRDAVQDKAALCVVQQPEQVAGLLDLHHVCGYVHHTHRYKNTISTGLGGGGSVGVPRHTCETVLLPGEGIHGWVRGWGVKRPKENKNRKRKKKNSSSDWFTKKTSKTLRETILPHDPRSSL